VPVRPSMPPLALARTTRDTATSGPPFRHTQVRAHTHTHLGSVLLTQHASISATTRATPADSTTGTGASNATPACAPTDVRWPPVVAAREIMAARGRQDAACAGRKAFCSVLCLAPEHGSSEVNHCPTVCAVCRRRLSPHLFWPV
jgi:hypothetical protein